DVHIWKLTANDVGRKSAHLCRSKYAAHCQDQKQFGCVVIRVMGAAPPWGQSLLRSYLASRSFPPPPPATCCPPSESRWHRNRHAKKSRCRAVDHRLRM